VVVTGLTDAPVPWPLGRRPGRSVRAGSLVLCGDLAEAVRRESALAICYHWKVTPQTVSLCRKALGVGAVNEGTHRLRSAYTAEPWAQEALDQAAPVGPAEFACQSNFDLGAERGRGLPP
jgi:hypothetical protein